MTAIWRYKLRISAYGSKLRWFYDWSWRRQILCQGSWDGNTCALDIVQCGKQVSIICNYRLPLQRSTYSFDRGLSIDNMVVTQSLKRHGLCLISEETAGPFPYSAAVLVFSASVWPSPKFRSTTFNKEDAYLGSGRLGTPVAQSSLGMYHGAQPLFENHGLCLVLDPDLKPMNQNVDFVPWDIFLPKLATTLVIKEDEVWSPLRELKPGYLKNLRKLHWLCMLPRWLVEVIIP